MIPRKSLTPRLLTRLAVLTFASALTAQAQELTWIGSSSATDFNLFGNYSPTPTSFHAQDLIFNTPVNGNLRMTANMNIGSLVIKEGASGFTLGRGSNRSLVLTGPGIIVEAQTHATINPHLVRHSANADFLSVNVGTGGSLLLGGGISPVTGQFAKNGAGLLTISQGSDAVRKLTNPNRQASFAFNEGTVELLSTARIGWGSDMPATVLPEWLEVFLGTSTTSATLTGAGRLEAQLITSGVNYSTIRPDGELTTHTVNAQAGATLDITLGSSLLKGDGIFTSATDAGGLAFHFKGGAVNTTYTLLQFSEIAGMEISDLSLLSEGYELDANFGTGGWQIDAANGTLQVRFAAIPEPGTASLAVASMVLLGAVRLGARKLEWKLRR